MKVPSSMAATYRPSIREEELKKYFSPFFHDVYGTCWSLDFKELGWNPVKPEQLYLSLQVCVHNSECFGSLQS